MDTNTLVADLKGLGPASAKLLNAVGVYTLGDLQERGVVSIYIEMQEGFDELKPSLNMLYAMTGALKNCSWLEVAKHQRSQLLAELSAQQEMRKIFKINKGKKSEKNDIECIANHSEFKC